MKVYLIQKHGNMTKLKDALMQEGVENVEIKPDISHRILKTDFVICADLEEPYEAYQKVNKLIVLMNPKEYAKVKKIASFSNIQDMIDIHSDNSYLARRIKGVIQT